jgi:hypothetical protein
LRLIENDNLNKFYGISFNQQAEMIVMWLYCPRGSLEVICPRIQKFLCKNLQDILFNDEMKLGRNFQVSFAKDVVKVGEAF